MTFEIRKFNLADETIKIVENFQTLMAEKNILLKIFLHDKSDEIVTKNDLAKFHSVLINLLITSVESIECQKAQIDKEYFE